MELKPIFQHEDTSYLFGCNIGVGEKISETIRSLSGLEKFAFKKYFLKFLHNRMSFSPNFRLSEPNSSRLNFRVINSLDLPNFLPVDAETGNLAYFDDQVWYKSASGWVSLNPANIVVRGNITTNSGNLILNPEGPSIDFSGKSVINAILPDPTITVSFILTSPSWTGSLNLTLKKVGKIVVYRISDASITANVSSTFFSPSVITDPSFLPERSFTQPQSIIVNGQLQIVFVRITSSTGNVSIENIPPSSSNFPSATVLNTSSLSIMGSYMTA